MIGCRGSIGTVHVSEPNSYINGNAMALDDLDTSRCLPSYLARFLRRRGFGDVVSGSSQPQLTRGGLANVLVPLPPLDEQRRIAAILDQADAIRAKRNAVTLALETLIRSTFDEMFSLGNWPRETLAELTECLDSKRRPVTAKDRPSGDVPYFGANNQQGWIDTPIFDEPLILVAEDGGWFETPEKGVAYRIDGPAWVNNHAHVLRAKPELETEYLHRVLKHFDFRPYISGSTRSKLNQKQLMSVTIPLPPLALQQEFAAKVQQIEQQRRLVEAALERDNELFASLQERAFSGGL